MSKITNDIKNVNLSTEFMPGMTTDSERTSLEVSFAEMK